MPTTDLLSAAFDVSVVLAPDFGYNPYGTSTMQQGLAVAMAVLALIAMTVGVIWYSSRVLSGSNEETAEHVGGQISTLNRVSTRVTRTENVDERAADLREMYDGDFEPDHLSVPAAVSKLVADTRENWRATTQTIPSLSLRIAEVGVLYLFLGALAVPPVAALVNALTSESDGFELADVVATGSTLLGQVGDALTAFPYFDLVYGLGFGYGVLAAEWFYSNYVVVGVAILAGAIVTGVLDYLTPDELDPKLYPSRLGLFARFTAAVSSIWITGVAVKSPFAALGFESIGNILGLLFATVVALVVAYFTIRGFVKRATGSKNPILEAYRERPVVASFLLARKLWAGLTLVAIPFLFAFAATIVTDGRLQAVGSALLEAPASKQVGVLTVVVTLVVVWVPQTRDAWGELRVALSETMSRRALRTAVYARALPLAAVFMAWIILIALPVPLGYALFGGVFVGVSLRIAYDLRTRAEFVYRKRVGEREQYPRRAIWEVLTVETPDGDTVYLAWVNSHALAAPTLDQIVDAVARDTKHYFDTDLTEIGRRNIPFWRPFKRRFASGSSTAGRPNRPYPASFEHHYFRDLTESGVADPDESHDRLRGELAGDLRLRFEENDNEVDENRLDDFMTARYPPDDYRSKKRELESERGRLERIGDKLRYHDTGY